MNAIAPTASTLVPCAPSARRHRRGPGVLLGLLIAPGAVGAAPPCDDWNLVTTPDVGNSVTRLTDAAMGSAHDGWAVGHWRDLPAGSGPLAMRWNGEAWSLTDLPSTAGLGTMPEVVGVDTIDGAAWVVGSVRTPYPTDHLPLVLRWSEGDWDYVETVTLRPKTVHPFADRGGSLREVATLASDDIWAVGQAVGFGDATATTVPLAVHWDGDKWTDIDVPRVANRHHELVGLVAISSDDVWAVGDYRNVASAFRGVVYHWDGHAWSHVPSPIEGYADSGLSDITATGPDDVWAIGNASSVGVVLMHWDGASWSLAPPPPNSGGSIVAAGPDDVWASGWDGFWHWDGSTWTDVPTAVPGATYAIRNGGMELLDACDIWSVGFWTLADGITSFTLAEHLEPAPTSPGDIDGDGIVSLSDLLALLASWGDCGGSCPPSCPADLDGDCRVGTTDLLIVLGHWS